MFVWAYLVYKPYFFNQRILFFSHTKSANSTFSHDLSAKQAQTNRTLNTCKIRSLSAVWNAKHLPLNWSFGYWTDQSLKKSQLQLLLSDLRVIYIHGQLVLWLISGPWQWLVLASSFYQKELENFVCLTRISYAIWLPILGRIPAIMTW